MAKKSKKNNVVKKTVKASKPVKKSKPAASKTKSARPAASAKKSIKPAAKSAKPAAKKSIKPVAAKKGNSKKAVKPAPKKAAPKPVKKVKPVTVKKTVAVKKAAAKPVKKIIPAKAQKPAKKVQLVKAAKPVKPVKAAKPVKPEPKKAVVAKPAAKKVEPAKKAAEPVKPLKSEPASKKAAAPKEKKEKKEKANGKVAKAEIDGIEIPLEDIQLPIPKPMKKRKGESRPALEFNEDGTPVKLVRLNGKKHAHSEPTRVVPAPVVTPKPVIVQADKKKEPKGKFEVEYLVHASSELLFEFLTTPSGLSEWFADDVNIRQGVYTFFWDGAEQQAKLIGYKEPRMARFQWADKSDGSYFEFRIEVDELTRDTSLIITDFAEDPAEQQTSKLLWDSQVSKLLQVIGAYY
jgi:uncharacterized protein YndB with AHSA1/START domain